MPKKVPAQQVLKVTVGSVEEREAGHCKGRPEGKEKAELSGLEDDDRQVHHGEAEADEAEAEGDEEADQALLL